MIAPRNPSKHPGPANLAAALVDIHASDGRGGETAVVSDLGRWTYEELARDTRRLAAVLAGAGVARGERVALLLGDRYEWVVAFLGAARLGAVPVALNTWLPARDYPFFLEHSQARVLVAGAALENQVRGALESSRARPRVVVVGGIGEEDPAVAVSFERFLEGAGEPAPDASPAAGDAAFWLYSSGTTGRPKGVVHRHESPVFSAETYARDVLGAGPDDVFYSAAKLFFAYGLGNGLYFPLRLGATSVLHDGRATPDAVFDQIERHRPTIFFGVPTLYAALLEHASSRAPEVDSLRLCVSAGEPLPAEIYSRWRERFGLEILDGIGTTEMVHIFISNAPGKVTPGATGRPVPGYAARVVDESGEEVAPGEIGNLLVRGQSTFSGYREDPEATDRTILDGGWVRTGDKYRVDDDGCYWYAGRGDDMLKVSGIWVSPFEVEAALAEHPAVLESAVIGVEDGSGLVKPKAFVVLSERASSASADLDETGSAELERELKDFVKQRIARYKYPRLIEFVGELPKTATGKIQRFKLRELERSREPTS